MLNGEGVVVYVQWCVRLLGGCVLDGEEVVVY